MFFGKNVFGEGGEGECASAAILVHYGLNVTSRASVKRTNDERTLWEAIWIYFGK